MLGCIGRKVGIVLPSKPFKIYTNILLSGAADGIASFLEFLIASLGLKFDASRKGMTTKLMTLLAHIHSLLLVWESHFHKATFVTFRAPPLVCGSGLV